MKTKFEFLANLTLEANTIPAVLVLLMVVVVVVVVLK